MSLEGKRIALFVEDVYNDLEFWYPRYRMIEEGADVTVVAPGLDVYSSKYGMPARSDVAIGDVSPTDFDAVIIPGGYAPDRMRRNEAMVSFVRNMDGDGKVIAAICHAGWMLVSAGIVKGRKVTSFFSIRDDLVNAGAEWVDDTVVRDGSLITSRTPDDLPNFCGAIIESLGG